MGQYEDLIDTLYELYAEEDEFRREALLDRVVIADIQFHGIQANVFGREAFARSFRDGGTQLVRTSMADHSSGWIRSTWELRLRDGTVAAFEDGRSYEGLQISELADDGRLRRIVPFLGITPPPISSPA